MEVYAQDVFKSKKCGQKMWHHMYNLKLDLMLRNNFSWGNLLQQQLRIIILALCLKHWSEYYLLSSALWKSWAKFIFLYKCTSLMRIYFITYCCILGRGCVCFRKLHVSMCIVICEGWCGFLSNTTKYDFTSFVFFWNC